MFDAQGRQLAENDDYPAPLVNFPDYSGTIDPLNALSTHSADSRLVYTFPKAGDYFLRIRDVQDKGGDEYAYRLTIAPPRPDFALRLATDTAQVSGGDSATLAVNVLRKDDFSGEIELAVRDLPPGFTVSEAAIAAGADDTNLTITAPAGAAATMLSPKVVGTAKVDAARLEREAVSVERLRQAFYYPHQVPTRGCLVQVEPAAFFALSTNVPPRQFLDVPQGGRVKVVVKAAPEGGNLPIALAADAPPRGINVTAANVSAGQAEAAVTISVSNPRWARVKTSSSTGP